MNRLRLRAIVYVVGIPLAVFGVISMGPAWLTLPLVGVAVAAVTVSLNKLTQRLKDKVCWTCGADLAGEPPHEHGITCTVCGSLNQHNPALMMLAQHDPSSAADEDADDAVRA